jgi:LmbE family N-acetylglucosaminyl deacetylase
VARILYIFPHPDDESFGPAAIIAKQVRHGHDVYLLTLTRGEATSQRTKYGYSKREMGTVRHREMQDVERTLGLTDMRVLDFPDGALANLNPLVLEQTIVSHIENIRPDVLVTYAVHGISGHPDHLVTHAVTKHAYCSLRANGADYLKRLALFTLPEKNTTDRPAHLKGSPPADIDCKVPFDKEDRTKAEEALACYKTYRGVIEQQKPLNHVADGVCFTLFGEHHETMVDDLLVDLDG